MSAAFTPEQIKYPQDHIDETRVPSIHTSNGICIGAATTVGIPRNSDAFTIEAAHIDATEGIPVRRVCYGYACIVSIARSFYARQASMTGTTADAENGQQTIYLLPELLDIQPIRTLTEPVSKFYAYIVSKTTSWPKLNVTCTKLSHMAWSRGRSKGCHDAKPDFVFAPHVDGTPTKADRTVDSVIHHTQSVIIDKIRNITAGDWKVLVIDENSKKIIYNVLKEDDILNHNIASEHPKVRYYRPRNPIHEASVLSSHLARFVSEELDEYVQWNPNFPPQSSRPQGVLVITDRSMDLMAPLIHEFTYQAMAHDLLPIKDGDKTTYRLKINEGTREAEEKDMELAEKDKVWVENRHRHMKDTIDKLMGDFRRFLEKNPHFVNSDSNTTSLNAIKDMMAGLPQFQEMKETYSLHMNMAEACMDFFQNHKLNDLSPIEQTMATGLDEDNRKPKNVLETVVRLLDDDAVMQSDRLRLIMMYLLYRDGVIPEDVKRLLAHASLPPKDAEIIANMELIGGRTNRGLKEPRRDNPPLFPQDTKAPVDEDSYMSRFNPALKHMLENLCKGTLDQTVFPYVKPPADPNGEALAGQGSLRATKPSWAGAGRRQVDNKQRIIVFMAGGATFSESRACYEVGAAANRDVFLATSHMLTPQLFVRQVGDLSADKRRLDLPMERPAPRAPAHLFERERPTPPPAMVPGKGPGGLPNRPQPSRPGGPTPAPPTQAMAGMSLGGGSSTTINRPPPPPAATANGGADYRHHSPSSSFSHSAPGGGDRPHKPEKEKKKRHFLGLKK
ncbi:hypothetical protein DL771_007863 [Monosporascus sp. 5C6A]|nr:hypothetical protein DL771_007863 [Monosporascus sp. 5C6A]